MADCKSTQEICDEIAGELREMAMWLADGQLNPEQFRAALLTLEAAKVKRFGFHLTGESAGQGRSHFELRFEEDDKLCATMDFASGSKELTVHHLCG